MAPTAETSQRSIRLGDKAVAYTLARSRRKTIALRIDHRGLRVGAPLRARIGDIEAMLAEHSRWVLEKLAHWESRIAAEPLSVHDGQTIQVLGQTCTLQLLEGSNRVFWHKDDLTLSLLPRPGAAPEALLEKALRDKARKIFAARMAHYAPLLGVVPPPMSLSSARTRWGSCSRTGIRLNWRLIHFPLEIVDYVVAHELAHLKEMNHSPRFWAVVESVYPHWRTARKRLRELAPDLPEI